MKALIIHSNNTTEVFEFDTENAHSRFSGAVNGYIQDVPQNFNSKATMYCNEEGKLQGLPLNRLATFLSGLYPQDIVVGDVVVVGACDEEGYDQGLDEFVIAAIQAIDVEATWANYLDAIENAGVKTVVVKERRDAA